MKILIFTVCIYHSSSLFLGIIAYFIVLKIKSFMIYHVLGLETMPSLGNAFLFDGSKDRSNIIGNNLFLTF